MSTQFTNRQWRLPNNENKDKQSNYSMDFDSASSDYIAINNNTTLNSISDSVSISQWIKFSGTSQQYITSFGNDYGTNVNVGKFYFVFRNTSNTQIQLASNSTINDGNWHHVVAVKTTSNITIYIDGVLDKTDTTGDVGRTSTRSNAIGALYDGSINFDGSIDAVSIFNYPLSSSQITTLYGSSSTGIGNPMSLSPKPVAYYPLGDQDAFNGANYLVPNSSLKDYVFDFSSDVINTNSLGISGANSRTISCWFNADNTSNQNIIGFGAASQGNNFTIAIYNSNIFAHTWNSGGVGGDLFGSAVTAGKWHLAVMTYDGTNLKISLDGGTYATTTASLNTTNSIFKIGSSYYLPWNLFSGKISNTKVWNTDLSQAEVTTLYNNGSPIRTLANIPQSSNFQGWWKLDASATYDSSTTTWTIPDSSTNSNDGTSSGMTQANLVQSDLSFTSGYSPYALDFDSASGDYIDCGTNNSLKPTSAYSISGWFKLDDITGTKTIISNDNNNGFMCWVVNDKLWFYHYDTTWRVFSSTTTLVADTWYHFVLTWNLSSTTGKMYINGVYDNQNTSFGQVTYLSTPVYIGTYGPSQYFEGNLSNVSIWNTELTSAQVSEIYSEGIPQNLLNHSAVSSLVSWWQLGSNSSFNTNWTVLDEKGSNNGTSVNMTEADIVNGVGSYANGLSSGMGGDEVIGDAPYSTANSLSVNMDVEDRVTDTPS